LAIARTIVLEPKLLLLDEPLSNLDAKLRGEMRIEIKRLHKQLGLTTVYVTHDQSEAMSLSDLVIVMRKGKIEQVGTPQDIYNCPNSLYVADFMGYSNRVAVTTLGQEGNTWTVQMDNGIQLRASTTDENSVNLQPGDRAWACSRPDEVTTDAPASANHLRGTVHLVEYIGKAFEVLVRLDGDEDTQLLIHSETPLVSETPVEFGVRPDRLLLFPFDSDASVSGKKPQAQRVMPVLS
jgi:putative spermidine/putrescine transport system ATP-binding protein